MKTIVIIALALLVLTVGYTMDTGSSEDKTKGYVDTDTSAAGSSEDKTKGYVLKRVASNVIVIEVEVEWLEKVDSSIKIKEALEEIAEEHIIQNCVPIKERLYGGVNRDTREVTSLLVFVEPKPACLS